MVLSEYISNLKIKVYGGNYTACPPSWAGSNVSLALHKLYFPLEGSAQITAGGRTYHLKARQAMLIPKGFTHSFAMTEEQYLVKYWLHFTALSDGNDLFEHFHDITVWDFNDEKDFSEICGYFRRLFLYENAVSENEASIGNALAHQAALFSIIGILFERSGHNHMQELSMHSTKPASIVEYIENHLNEPIKVEELARLLYMHPTAFIRYFKHHFGMPPLKYIKCLRLERSKHYLETTSLPISEIAELTGFGDSSHLSRDFRSTYGISPGQARK